MAHRVALSVAASVAYYFARQDINERRRDQAARNSRSLERQGWEEQVYDFEMAKAGKARPGAPTAGSPAPPTAAPAGPSA